MKPRHDMINHGVNIVCAEHDGVRGGLAVAWATQVAVNEVLVCIGAQSHTRDLILASGAFGVSVLAQEHLEMARAFGGRHSRNLDKFADVATHTGETGSPLLDACALTLDCRVIAVHDQGSHKLIVGKVVAAERRLECYQPLIYRQEDY